MQKILSLFVLLAIATNVSAEPGHDETPAEPEDHTGVVGPEMLTNETWTYTFTEVGEFDYHCHPHPWMQAMILVEPSDGSAPVNHEIRIIEPENYEEWDFDPITLTIQAGDNVTWVNDGMQMHKVAQTTEEHAEHIAGAGSTVDDADEHGEHDHASSPTSDAVLWIGGSLALGVIVAMVVRKS